jgi:ferredoxin
MKKYDERETLFSRISLEKGTKEYEEFYAKNPQYQKDDDSIRGVSFRDNLRKSDEFKKRFFPLTANNKLFIKNLHDLVENFEVKERQVIEHSFAKNLKEIGKYYGATDVGMMKLKDSSYYEYLGGLSDEIGLDTYGKKVKRTFNTAIVFTVKMDLEFMNRAPHFEELLTTEEAYLKVAQVGARIAVYIKSLGYRAMFNHSEYYLAPLVPLAVDAGLGEIGICNHLVTKEHGNNVRLGAVFTNLQVDYDQPIEYGLNDFCKICSLCMMNCPSKSITHKERMVNGKRFFKFDDASCFALWNNSGTDCGTCIQSCPFTQGVDLFKVNQMKDNPKMMKQIMEEYLEEFGRRNYTKKELSILNLEDKDD